ncbi:MAG: hypothetical protein K9K67_12815 [Bacteriovoracaceae bacterium]|nr:hypothetical protein [Bacteriovoracaceae bacterium]
MLKKETKKHFQKYLTEHSLSEPLYFGSNQVLSFHWANDQLASGYVKSLKDGGEKSFSQRIETLKAELDSLKEIPLWLMSRRGQIKSDLHNLYQSYLDPRLKIQWFNLEEILVSTNHEAGPFSSLKSMRWFDKNIYAKFIYLKMLESWVPQRSFRLSLDIPVEIRAGGSPFDNIQGKIHQVSAHGVVLHLSSCSKAKQWGNVDEIIFLKKEMQLEEERGIETCLKSREWLSSLENFTVKGEDFQLIINKGLEGQGDKDNFLFIPFTAMRMLSIKAHEKCLTNLLSLFEETESTIHRYIEAA